MAKKNSTGLIVGLALGAVVLAGGGGVAAYALSKGSKAPTGPSEQAQIADARAREAEAAAATAKAQADAIKAPAKAADVPILEQLVTTAFKGGVDFLTQYAGGGIKF